MFLFLIHLFIIFSYGYALVPVKQHVTETPLDVIEQVRVATKSPTVFLNSDAINCIQNCTFDSTFKTAKCYTKTLQQIPVHLCNISIEKLLISDNLLNSLPNNSFANYTSLVFLDLAWNMLSDNIEPDAFVGMSEIKTINLSRNNITTLPKALFSSVQTTIEKIYLNDNNIHVIDSQTFFNLTKLKILSIMHNKLASLSPNMFKDLHSLEHLYVYLNNLTSIPNGLLDPLTKLKFLHLGNNSIKDIPSNIFDISENLSSIMLYSNELKYIPMPGNASLPNLLRLDISNNKISNATNITYFVQNSKSKIWISGNLFTCESYIKKLHQLLPQLADCFIPTAISLYPTTNLLLESEFPTASATYNAGNVIYNLKFYGVCMIGVILLVAIFVTLIKIFINSYNTNFFKNKVYPTISSIPEHSISVISECPISVISERPISVIK